jgi:hypothetical protein
VVALFSAAALFSTGATARADAGCDLYAAPGGNDDGTGSKADPKQNPVLLLNALAPGQTGCLEDGAVFQIAGCNALTATAGAAGQPKTLRPETPGSRAEIRAECGFAFTEPSHDLVLRDLDLRKHGATGGSLIQVNGDRITLDGVDFAHPGNICLDIGGDPRAGGGALDSADDVVIRNSRVHHCGSAYGAPHEVNDSGVHGIYAEFTRRLLIEDNFVYANNNRGIQLYPDADATIIRRNVLHGNGANLNIGSERNDGIYSENTLAEDNILTDSVLSGVEPGGFVGDTSEVLGNFPAPGPGVPAATNRVERNCISNTKYPNELYEGYGFTQADNVENKPPGYANAAAGDFRLSAGSPCLGKGPRSIQPGVTPTLPETSLEGGPAEGSSTESRTAAFTFSSSDGGASFECSLDAGAFTVCTSPMMVEALPLGPHSFRVRAKDGAGNVDPSPAERRWTIVSGAECAGVPADLVGTDRADFLTGFAAREVIQALGGDDTIRELDADSACGGDGYDTFRSPFRAHSRLDGEAGADLVDYSGVAGGPVRVDLEGAGGGEDAGPGFGNALHAISDVYGSAGDDAITGSSDSNFVRGGRGGDTVSGERGDDLVFGERGADTIDGGSGADGLHGGGGRDTLRGGRGDDKMSGGPDVNRYRGGAGNDAIDARNRTRELVDCGRGRRDTARVDRRDRVRGCERIRRPKR